MSKNNAKKKKYVFISIITVFLLTLTLAIIISSLTQLFMTKLSSIYLAFLLLTTIILLGIFFDIIGIAATASTEVPFHAKSAKRVFGASHTIKLIRNADKVANFANDVVGDISGTISGALGAAIVFELLKSHPTPREAFIETLMTAFIAALTVTGKALGKSFAIHEANNIIFKVGKLWAMLEKPMAFFGMDDDRKRGN